MGSTLAKTSPKTKKWWCYIHGWKYRCVQFTYKHCSFCKIDQLLPCCLLSLFLCWENQLLTPCGRAVESTHSQKGLGLEGVHHSTPYSSTLVLAIALNETRFSEPAELSTAPVSWMSCSRARHTWWHGGSPQGHGAEFTWYSGFWNKDVCKNKNKKTPTTQTTCSL